ncbi:spore germination protein [Longirhabdus pacifica]|uniref:spore germination protein n=1 Tax=Longirhabdus pacifica TaxID=2305227 RepID=UPI00100900F5|nr:spore germination protein [Longirhabdus pacifica]
MPAIVGASKFINIGGSSILKFGDAVFLCPTSSGKTYTGAGSGNVGDGIFTVNVASSTNTFDPSIASNNATKLPL